MNGRFLKQVADLRKPHNWFPLAREIDRKFIYHTGPTNSGKTYAALNALKKAEKGIYLGPLRLLANEIYEKLRSEGLKCSLITGQEEIIDEEATHISATIETANFYEDFDVAIIDEIQMISDPHRGSAWTNAVLGLWCPEIHLTGDIRPKKLLESILKDTKESIETIEYERHSEIIIDPPLKYLTSLQPGDCIVTFSRKKCHILRKFIEKELGECAIIYGNLPPEARKEQARKFNERKDVEYLVSTDAVGLGVNYEIDRIIFFETKKFEGNRSRKLHNYEVRQIAGRAGRYKKQGRVSAINMSDLEYIQKCLNERPVPLKKAALLPSFSQIEQFAEDFKGSYDELLDNFESMAELEKKYFFQNIQDARAIARRIKKYNLTLEDNYIFCQAPVKLKNAPCLEAFESFARELSENGEVPLIYKPVDQRQSLEKLEEYYFILELYIWLAKKYSESLFIDLEMAEYEVGKCIEVINAKLEELPMAYIKKEMALNHIFDSNLSNSLSSLTLILEDRPCTGLGRFFLRKIVSSLISKIKVVVLILDPQSISILSDILPVLPVISNSCLCTIFPNIDREFQLPEISEEFYVCVDNLQILDYWLGEENLLSFFRSRVKTGILAIANSFYFEEKINPYKYISEISIEIEEFSESAGICRTVHKRGSTRLFSSKTHFKLVNLDIVPQFSKKTDEVKPKIESTFRLGMTKEEKKKKDELLLPYEHKLVVVDPEDYISSDEEGDEDDHW